MQYAEYCIAQVPGNRGQKGSVISESNHSSVLSYLNDGVRGTKTYQEHPMLLVRDLLARQQKHVIPTNQRLHNMHQNMKIEQAKLANQPVTFAVSDLKLAASKLNHVGYLSYKSQQARRHMYALKQIIDPVTNEIRLNVHSTRRPEAPPRTLKLDIFSRCPCAYRVAEQDMCVREIVEKGGFGAELFEERHFQRQYVSGSINGWVAPPKEKLNEILGFSPEHIEIERSISSRKQILQTDMNIQMFNPFLEGNADDPVPFDYLPERGVSTNPFTGKEVENVLHSVM